MFDLIVAQHHLKIQWGIFVADMFLVFGVVFDKPTQVFFSVFPYSYKNIDV